MSLSPPSPTSCRHASVTARARLNRRQLLLGAATILAASGRASAQPATPAPTRAARIPQVRIGVPAQPPSPDPAALVSVEDLWLSTLVYDAPLRWTPDGVIVDGLLGRAAGRPDALQHTLVIRRGARFSDGRPVTPDDVRYSLERIRNTGEQGRHGWRLGAVRRIESLDDRRLRIDLHQPDVSLIASLAHPAFAVIPAGANLQRDTVGTGPFVWNGQTSTTIRYTRNPAFREIGRPRIDALEAHSLPDDSNRAAALATGSLDLMPNLPLLDYPILATDPTVYLVGGSNSRLCYLQCNHRETSVLRDERIRRLLAVAIERTALATTATSAQALPTGRLFAGTDWASPDNPEPPPDTPDRTRQRLRALRIDADLRLRLLADNADAMVATTAILLQDQLAQRGIALAVDLLEGAALDDARRFGRHDLLIDVTDPWHDPHELVHPILGTTGVRNWMAASDDQLDRLIESATVVADRAVRQPLYAAIERRMIRLGSIIPLYRPPWYDAVSTGVGGYRALPPITARGILTVRQIREAGP